MAFVLTDATVLDGTPTAQPERNRTIVVADDGTIAQVVPDGTVLDPALPVADLQGAFVVPGLIDLHGRMDGGGHIGRVPQDHDRSHSVLGRLRTLGDDLPFHSGEKDAREILSHGVTTVRTFGSRGYDDVALRSAIEGKPHPGLRIIPGGPVAAVREMPWQGERTHRVDDVGEATAWARESFSRGARHLPVAVDVVVPATGELHRMDRRVLQTLVEAAHDLALAVTAQAITAEGARTALLAGVDTLIYARPMDEDMIELCHGDGTGTSIAVAYTLSPTVPPKGALSWSAQAASLETADGETAFRRTLAGLERALGAGIPVGLGTQGGYPFTDRCDLWSQLVVLQRRTDLDASRILSLATTGAASILGLDGVTGSIAAGLSADLVVVAGDPREDFSVLANPDLVVVRGRVVSRDRKRLLG